MKHHRNAKPAVFEEKFLDGIGQLRHFARIFALARVAGPANLAETVPFLKAALAFGDRNFHRRSRASRFFLPDAHHLRDFFRQVMRDNRSLTRRAADSAGFL